MILRKLELRDAPLMLEWMHDKNVCEFMKADFASKTLEDCETFIQNSLKDKENIHLAIISDEEYMGTVSLKNIDLKEKIAEFAITVRHSAMGRGISEYGMKEIIQMGLNELGLKSIIWCVSKNNIRANKFYNKNGYKKVKDIPENYKILYPNWKEMNWYMVCR